MPEADFVSMHGLWSWVPPAVRAGVVRLLRDKVRRAASCMSATTRCRPGAARSACSGCCAKPAASSPRAATGRRTEGFKLVRELHAAGAYQLVRSQWMTALIERLAALPDTYLAHEYMNDSWAPCFHADVAEALAGAKLEWVASANLIENFAELTLTPSSARSRTLRRPADARTGQGHVPEPDAAPRRVRARARGR